MLGFTMAQGGSAYVTHKEALETFWEEAELLANTMIFCISGLIIVDNFQLEGLFTLSSVGASGGGIDFEPIDWFFLASLYVALQFIRFFATFSLYVIDVLVCRNCRCCRCFSYSRVGGCFGEGSFAHRTRHIAEGLLLSRKRLIDEYDTSWRTATVASWGGLRGAIGLCLALMVSNQFKNDCEHGCDTNVSSVPVGPKFLFHMSGVALLTLVVNGST